jgi:hypothetical protein
MDIDHIALRALLDKEAIREASLRYTRGIDRHDDEIASRAYHPDATDDHGFYIGDALGFIKRAGEVHARTFDVHHHYTMNQTIELDGDTAHVETYFLTALRRKSGPIDLVGGRYVDRFERREGQWRIGHRTCLVEWRGELPPTSEVDTTLFAKGSWDQTDHSYRRPIDLERERCDLRA